MLYFRTYLLKKKQKTICVHSFSILTAKSGFTYQVKKCRKTKKGQPTTLQNGHFRQVIRDIIQKKAN